MTLVDTNVLLDVIGDDARWGAWSSDALARAIDSGPVIINPIVYAEASLGFDSEAELDSVLRELSIDKEPLPYEAAFPAGRAFAAYRRRGGSRTAVLPDFYIGAHALASGHALLTRDARRYRTSFPALTLIAPTRR